MLLTEYIIDL